MLSLLRTFIKGWTAKILFLLLVGSFALWGTADQAGHGGAGGYTVAEVGGTKVSPSEFIATYNQSLNTMQQRFGRRFNQTEAQAFGVPAQALGTVVSFATLDEFARVNSMSLSESMLARMIADNEAFQDSAGAFSQTRFVAALRNARMREADFINLQNSTAVRSQISQAVATGNIVPEVFKNGMGQFLNEERKFSYLRITPKQAGTPAAPTDEQLKKQFEDNKASYAAPEYRKLNILALEPKDLADESKISDEDVAADYEARKQTYVTAERRRVQQVVFKDAAAAEAAKKSMSEGATFETILEENGTKLSDADLGFLLKANVPEALRDIVFGLELNTVSDVIDGPFGATLARVTEIEESKTTSLEDVKAEIRRELAFRKAAEDLNGVQEQIEDMRAGGTSLTEIASKLKLKSRTIDAIDARGRTDKDELINDIPESSSVLRQAFQTEVGAQASPLDIGQTGLVWYEVLSIEPARDRTFDEVKDRVTKDWTVAEQQRLLTAKAEEIQEKVNSGQKLGALALEMDTLEETTGFTKRSAEFPDFKRTSVQAGFEVKLNTATTAPVAGKEEYLVIVPTESKGTSSAEVKITDEQVQVANGGAGDDMLNQLINNLRNRFEVTQNPAVASQLIQQYN